MGLETVKHPQWMNLSYLLCCARPTGCKCVNVRCA